MDFSTLTPSTLSSKDDKALIEITESDQTDADIKILAKQILLRRGIKILNKPEIIWDRFWNAIYRLDGSIGNAEKYSEPGCTDESKYGILLNDWNDFERNYPKFHEFLEKNFSLEWEGEWIRCECGGIVRTTPTCYSWSPSYWLYDGGIMCFNCINDEPDEYFEHLTENNKPCSVDIDPGAHGWTLLDYKLPSLVEKLRLESWKLMNWIRNMVDMEYPGHETIVRGDLHVYSYGIDYEKIEVFIKEVDD